VEFIHIVENIIKSASSDSGGKVVFVVRVLANAIRVSMLNISRN
jgi:hypothetical protein